MNKLNNFRSKRNSAIAFVQRLVLFVSLVLFSYMTPIQIANATLYPTRPIPPKINIRVTFQGFNFSTFKRGAPDPFRADIYNIHVTIDEVNWRPVNLDLYVGVIEPENNSFYSWSIVENKVNFSQGLLPIASIKNTGEPSRTHSGDSNPLASVFTLAHDLNFKITGNELSGMYLVFAALVAENQNPLDSSNWAAFSITPFLL